MAKKQAEVAKVASTAKDNDEHAADPWTRRDPWTQTSRHAAAKEKSSVVQFARFEPPNFDGATSTNKTTTIDIFATPTKVTTTAITDMFTSPTAMQVNRIALRKEAADRLEEKMKAAKETTTELTTELSTIDISPIRIPSPTPPPGLSERTVRISIEGVAGRMIEIETDGHVQGVDTRKLLRELERVNVMEDDLTTLAN